MKILGYILIALPIVFLMGAMAWVDWRAFLITIAIFALTLACVVGGTLLI